MWDWNIVPWVDFILFAHQIVTHLAPLGGSKAHHYPVDGHCCGLGQPPDSTMEFTGLGNVTNSKSEMKRANRHPKPLSFYGIYLLHLCGPNLHKLTFS
jgi:hypothetical protein